MQNGASTPAKLRSVRRTIGPTGSSCAAIDPLAARSAASAARLFASATGAPQETTASAVSRTATGATSGDSATWPCFRASSRRRGVADAARRGRPEALEERADQQVVYVEDEEDQQRQQLLPLGDDRHLAVRLRVDQVGNAEPHLDTGELAAELHAREDELGDEAE